MQKDQFFLDLQKVLTTNPAFATRAAKLMDKLMKASAANDAAGVQTEMLALLRLCDYNPTLLVPYFFPHFPEQDPMSLLSRPHAVSMMAFIPNGRCTVCASRQIGKCLDGESKLRVRRTGEAYSGELRTIESIFEEAKLQNATNFS